MPFAEIVRAEGASREWSGPGLEQGSHLIRALGSKKLQNDLAIVTAKLDWFISRCLIRGPAAALHPLCAAHRSSQSLEKESRKR
jgi:hypothetical protein